MNIEKKQERENRILEAAFVLYAKRKIESVTMEDVADATGIGVATVYRYYGNKLELASRVCTYKWGQYFQSKLTERTADYIKDINAIDRLNYTFDQYIDLYQNHKELLKVNDDFNHFYHENNNAESLPEYGDVFGAISNRFHNMYERAKVDGTMRTDVPEEQLQRVLFHTMMGACNHYLGGFSWGEADSQDYTQELIMLKNILMEYARGNLVNKTDN